MHYIDPYAKTQYVPMCSMYISHASASMHINACMYMYVWIGFVFL